MLTIINIRQHFSVIYTQITWRGGDTTYPVAQLTTHPPYIISIIRGWYFKLRLFKWATFIKSELVSEWISERVSEWVRERESEWVVCLESTLVILGIIGNLDLDTFIPDTRIWNIKALHDYLFWSWLLHLNISKNHELISTWMHLMKDYPSLRLEASSSN